MKASKILAGLSAAAIAGSMLSMVSFADSSATITFSPSKLNKADSNGSITITETGDYTVECDLTIAGTGEEAEDVSSVVGLQNTGYFSSTVNTALTVNTISVNGNEAFAVGAELNNIEQWQNGLKNIWGGLTEGDVVYGTAANGFVYDGSAIVYKLDGETTNIETIEYNITVTELDVTPAGEIDPYKAPDDAIIANGGKSWSGVEFDSLNGVEFGAWDGIWFQVEYGKEGFEADTSNAEVHLVLQTAEPIAEGSEAIRVINTNDGTDYGYKSTGNETNNVYELVMPYADFIDAMKAEEKEDNIYETGFGCNAQFAAAGTAFGFMTGVTYTEIPPAEDGVEIEIKEGISFDTPVKFDPTEDLDENTEYTSATFKLTGLSKEDKGKGEEEDASYWNDWCDVAVKITAPDGTVTWRVIAGPQVGWDITVDDNGTPEDKEDDTIIPVGDPRILFTDGGEKNIGSGDIEFTIPFTYGTTVEFIGIAWGGEDNEELGVTDDPYMVVETAFVGFTPVDEPTPVDPTPVDPTPVTPLPGPGTESEPLDSNSTGSPTTSGGSTNSNTSSGSTSSAAAGKSGDSNPATGAAALGTVGVLLAGAAMAVSKKRK